MQRKGFVLRLTGLSGAGKTTIAKMLVPLLQDKGLMVERLDGDVVRERLTKDLGFSKEDRATNLDRVSFVAKLLSRNGVGVVSSFISPYIEARQKVRDDVTNYIEVFVNAPLEECERRDVKGMYKLAREGTIKNFTGISDPYEAPVSPDIECKTDQETVQESCEKIVAYLEEKGYL